MKISEKRRSLLRRETVFKRRVIPATLAALGLSALLPGTGTAELASLSDVPLAQAPETAVLPNLMYILDDSGSMMWDYMPDNIHSGPGAGSGTRLNCKSISCSSTACSPNVADEMCRGPDVNGSGSDPVSDWGEPPYYSSQFNQIYYNPAITYDQAVDSTGAGLGNINSASAPKDFYLDQTAANKRNLTNQYPDLYYCITSSPSTAQLATTSVCRRNGVDNISTSTNNYFLYWSNSLLTTGPQGAYPSGSSSSTAFRQRVVRYTGNPYYFK